MLTSCAETENDNNSLEPSQPDPNQVQVVIPTGNENYLNKKSDYIFDQDRLHTFELTLPERNLEKLDNDPTAEKYVEGSLTFEGETLSPIGIRYKAKRRLLSNTTLDPIQLSLILKDLKKRNHQHPLKKLN